VTDLALRRFGEVAQQLKLTIPDSPEATDAEAEMLVGLTHGGNWGVAALVSSRTEAQPGKRTDLVAYSARLTYKEYAALGLRGLLDRETVAFYAKVWESRFPKPMPGETIALPDESFPVRVASAHLAPLMSSAEEDWHTPAEVIAAVIAVLGKIDLDPCSNEGEPNIPAGRHFTRNDDGLAQTWTGRIYMNPPYGRVIDDWVEKWVSEPGVTQGIALVPSRTDTAWFRRLRDLPRCFISGRLRFSGADPAPFPSMAVYRGERPTEFRKGFDSLGDTYARVR
jgi:hypothetical protein